MLTCRGAQSCSKSPCTITKSPAVTAVPPPLEAAASSTAVMLRGGTQGVCASVHFKLSSSAVQVQFKHARAGHAGLLCAWISSLPKKDALLRHCRGSIGALAALQRHCPDSWHRCNEGSTTMCAGA
jgi:hypothetical protein